jgi:transposase
MEYTYADFTGQDVFVGIDASKRNWRVAVRVGQKLHKRFAQAAEPEVLMSYLRRHFPGALYHCVYEAGYEGFWIHDRLTALGGQCMVVHPADVPSSDKERQFKNDPVDADKLSRDLSNGALHGIYVPTRSSVEDRTLVRMRSTFVRKQTRCKNQIKALLEFYGYRVPPEQLERYWSRAYIRWIESLKMERPSGQHALQALLQELIFIRQTIAQINRRIRTLASEEPYVDRFATLDELASYVGLVPGERSSGQSQVFTGITYRRNAALRYMLIECAWAAQREDPALLQAFTQLCRRMPKNRAIVRIARKLLNRMRFAWKNRQSYVVGVAQAA